MTFVTEWIVCYAVVMFAMCVDNIFWISASPEYLQFKKWSFGKKIIYVLKDRIWAVLKHPRDIIPGIITSFILAVMI